MILLCRVLLFYYLFIKTMSVTMSTGNVITLSCFALQVPICIPVMVVLVSLYLVFAPIIQDPKLQFIYAVIFILSGLFVYFPLVYGTTFKDHLRPIMGKSSF